MGIFRRILKRVAWGLEEGQKEGTILRRIADALPSVISGNAKAITGSAAATAFVAFVHEQFGWDLSSWEIYIGLTLTAAIAIWRQPNRKTP